MSTARISMVDDEVGRIAGAIAGKTGSREAGSAAPAWYGVRTRDRVWPLSSLGFRLLRASNALIELEAR